MASISITPNFTFFSSWRTIIDHLLTHEKTMFKDLMSKHFLIIVTELTARKYRIQIENGKIKKAIYLFI